MAVQAFTANADGDWIKLGRAGAYKVNLTVAGGSFAGTITASYGSPAADGVTPERITPVTGFSMSATGSAIIEVGGGEWVRFTKGGTALASGVTATVVLTIMNAYRT